MTTKPLSFKSLPSLAIAEGATTPNPGSPGVWAWSQTLTKPVFWNGSSWTAGSAGGGGAGDVVGPAATTDNHLPVFSGTTGKIIKEATFFDIPAIDIPNTPASGDLRWFARNRALRILPHIIGPSGVDVALQPALFGNTIYLWTPSTGTTVSANFGTSWTARNSGTASAQAHPTRASTNAMTSLSRATFGTGTTATGASGIQSAIPVAWRGNAANLGGWYATWRFGVETTSADLRVMISLSALNAALNGEPSVQANSIGLCKDSTDTSWQLFTRNATTTTKVPTGLAITAGQILDFTMFAAPNAAGVGVRLVDAVNGTVYVDNTNIQGATLPVNTTFLYANALIQSVTGTTAKLLALNRIYVETDL